MMEAGDVVYILFLAICFWLAVSLDDGDGGGRKRARLPV